MLIAEGQPERPGRMRRTEAAKVEVIEVRVPELSRLFNPMDPSPLYDRDLDVSVEEFIVDWAREAPGNAPLELLVHVSRADPQENDVTLAGDPIHAFFRNRAERTRFRLRALLRNGRTSLTIGIAFLAVVIAIGDLVAWLMHGNRLGEIIAESVMIGGWVAMWRPLEIFLYDWWPLRAEARLYDRLASVPVTLRYDAEHGAP